MTEKDVLRFMIVSTASVTHSLHIKLIILDFPNHRSNVDTCGVVSKLNLVHDVIEGGKKKQIQNGKNGGEYENFNIKATTQLLLHKLFISPTYSSRISAIEGTMRSEICWKIWVNKYM